MIRTAIDRAPSTKRSLGISTGIHGVAMVALVIWGIRTAVDPVEANEITEISYIEARYGEDIAAKVKLKTQPRQRSQGMRGVASQSAQQKQQDSPAPRSLAEASLPQSQPTSRPAKAIAQPKLTNRSDAPVHTPIVADADLRRTIADVTAADAKAPRPDVESKGSYKGKASALVGRESRLDPSKAAFDIEADSGSRLALDIPAGGSADGQPNLVGGKLEAGRKGYAGGKPALTPRRGGAGVGLADATGPVSPGGSEARGRRTILDYGAGQGGRGNLSGKPGLAEAKPLPAPTSRAVRKPAGEDLAEAKLPGAKGISMQITGEIKGRKILSSVAPVYSELAKRNGWEGIAAVHFTVLPNGKVKDNVYLEQASTHRDLNRAAMDAIRKFVFAPLPPSEAAVEQWGVITIVFRLR